MDGVRNFKPPVRIWSSRYTEVSVNLRRGRVNPAAKKLQVLVLKNVPGS